MTTDGGGYTFLKVSVGSAYDAVQAEAHCAGLGMQLFIPRTSAHLASAWSIANNASIGASASDLCLYIMGIYPKVQGNTCVSVAMTSATCTGWHASDDGPYWVSNRTDITEPNGDNGVTLSMYYSFLTDGTIDHYNDIGSPGYTSSTFICDVGDKWGP